MGDPAYTFAGVIDREIDADPELNLSCLSRRLGAKPGTMRAWLRWNRGGGPDFERLRQMIGRMSDSMVRDTFATLAGRLPYRVQRIEPSRPIRCEASDVAMLALQSQRVGLQIVQESTCPAKSDAEKLSKIRAMLREQQSVLDDMIATTAKV
jgi:hypothetical protein